MVDNKFLMDVPSNAYFNFSNGTQAKNLTDIYNIINSSDDYFFAQYANPQKNDFAEWIKAVIGHQELYNKLIGLRDKNSFLTALKSELDALNASSTQTPPASNPSVPAQSSPAPAESPPAPTQAPVQTPAQPVPPSQPVPQQSAPPVQTPAQPVPPSQPVPQQSAPPLTPLVSQPQPSSASSSASSSDAEPSMEFEEILKPVIEEINKEIDS